MPVSQIEAGIRRRIQRPPDSDVLPTQGYSDQVLGNFLRDDWKQIYR